jgi:hypothetical protein
LTARRFGGIIGPTYTGDRARMTPPAAAKEPRILGLAIAVAALVMILGVAGAAFALIRQDFGAAGVCLLAAGLTAGLLVNAILRT